MSDNVSYLAIEDYNLSGAQEPFLLEKGKTYTKNQLVEIVGSTGRLTFLLKATKLKYCLVAESEETVAEETASEETASVVFLVNEALKKGKKIIFKAGDKIGASEISEFFDIASLLKEKKIMEIKVENV